MGNRETAAVRLTVSKDGDGAFKTVQEAVDAYRSTVVTEKKSLLKKAFIKRWFTFRRQSRL